MCRALCCNRSALFENRVRFFIYFVLFGPRYSTGVGSLACASFGVSGVCLVLYRISPLVRFGEIAGRKPVACASIKFGHVLVSVFSKESALVDSAGLACPRFASDLNNVGWARVGLGIVAHGNCDRPVVQ
jgi:hypothetical protein